MVAYPTSLAAAPTDYLHTPSHGGMVAGNEFDVPISSRRSPPPQADNSQVQPRTLPTPAHTLPTSPVPRPQPVNGARLRPRTMPMAPAQYANGATTAANDRESGTTTESSSRAPKPRSSNRVLGDYTLGKTLGAGSMGKVKLAHHNITGEKVRFFTVTAPPSP